MRKPRPDWSPLGVNFKILDKHPQLFLYSSPPSGASHRYSRRSRGSNPVEALNFFQASFPNCINWLAHGEDRAIAC